MLSWRWPRSGFFDTFPFLSLGGVCLRVPRGGWFAAGEGKGGEQSQLRALRETAARLSRLRLLLRDWPARIPHRVMPSACGICPPGARPPRSPPGWERRPAAGWLAEGWPPSERGGSRLGFRASRRPRVGGLSQQAGGSAGFVPRTWPAGSTAGAQAGAPETCLPSAGPPCSRACGRAAPRLWLLLWGWAAPAAVPRERPWRAGCPRWMPDCSFGKAPWPFVHPTEALGASR